MQLQVRCPNCHEIIDFGVGTGQAVLCPTCGGEVRNPAESLPQLELDHETEAEPDAEVASEPNVWDSVEIRPKIRPQAPSIARRAIPPLLGGLAAIPISIAILWYGFGRDIGNAGPTVAKFAPWIVPDALRGGIRKRITTSPATSHQPTNDERRFGPLGSQSRKPLESRIESPTSDEPRDQSLDATEPTGVRTGHSELTNTIQRLHDTWETDPVAPRSELLAAVYGMARELVSTVDHGSIQDGDHRDKLRESIRKLMNQSWFVESIEQATAGNLPDVYPPAILDYVLFAVESVQWDEGDEIHRRILVSPSTRLNAKELHWIADPALSSWLPLHGTEGTENRYLILGQVIGRDGLSYTVRVDAVLP